MPRAGTFGYGLPRPYIPGESLFDCYILIFLASLIKQVNKHFCWNLMMKVYVLILLKKTSLVFDK